MTSTTPTRSLFELNGITSGMALQEYCMTKPHQEVAESVYGEGLDSLFQKAISSMAADMINEVQIGSMSRAEIMDACRFNLYLVGLTKVDGCKIGIADLLVAADNAPRRVNELGLQLYIDSGIAEAAEACGVDDDNVSHEEYSRRMQEWAKNNIENQ
ncbi:hypothetical protein SynBIOSU31_02081 [Synechococcus sp. BIOS-U3-1]|uniref:hypothetical protein n=1 Tax=Synechococcus sp. BIOS-U3-1 TaxID=1400865 RepID=UPI00164449F7|nr:hypothetical protein [Synechococcus sp. BIOS-U3-1]QNI58947.1 hypothetical protein SynBIOSU31_02081 [Synechococcus sp. BIOS-U3-1]